MARRARVAIPPGVTKIPDGTTLDALNWTDADGVRFVGGKLRELDDYGSIALLNDAAVDGKCRWLFNYFLKAGNKRYTLIGTHKKLYALLGGVLTNITPLVTTATATLGTDPLALTSGDATMTVTYATHGLAVGDRIKFSGATHGTGGFADSYINVEHIIATVPTADTFTVELTTTAPATDATEGGAAVEIFTEIADGQADSAAGYGYGMGPYSAGVYGRAKTGTNPISPRIWSGALFGNIVILTPGGAGKLYEWSGSLTTAPTVVTNAPTQVNGVFVINNFVKVWGSDNEDDRLEWSDQGDRTVWTAAASNQAGSDDIEGARKFIGQVEVQGESLLFTETQVWRDTPTGNTAFPFRTTKLFDDDGLIGQKACVSMGGVAYWMGKRHFYRWYGGRVEIIPKNTVRDYVFSRLNTAQGEKCFADVREQYGEIWFWYPSTEGSEIDSYVIYNALEGHWVPGSLDRTAAAEGQAYTYPIMINSSGTVYQHEKGVDAGSESISLTIYSKLYAQAGNVRTYGPYTVGATTEKVDVRVTGRLRKYKLSGTGPDSTTWYVESNYAQIGNGDEVLDILTIVPDSTIDGYTYRQGRWFEALQAGGER